jgi:hypothetical protein
MDQIDQILDGTQEPLETVKELHFKCPNCGIVTQDDVVFLCNTCESKEMLHKNGVYVCPQCLKNGHNFLCMNCDSKDVTLTSEL